MLLLLLLLYGLWGYGIPAVGREIDRGNAEPGAFGLLIAALSFFLSLLATRLEAAVLGLEQRPWLAGRLRWWQRWLLPYSTARVMTLAVSWGIGGALYLTAGPEKVNVFVIVALCLTVLGGMLAGFGLARLVVGHLVIRNSGLWAASKRAWIIAAVAVAASSLLLAIYWLVVTLEYSQVL
jgi:hypothetical protein